MDDSSSMDEGCSTFFDRSNEVKSAAMKVISELHETHINNLLESVWQVHRPLGIEDAIIYMSEIYSAKLAEFEALQKLFNAQQKSTQTRHGLLKTYSELNDSYIVELEICNEDKHRYGSALKMAENALRDLHEKRNAEIAAYTTLLDESALLRHEFNSLRQLQEETQAERDRAIRLYVQEKDARTKQVALIARLSARLNALLPRRKHETCPDWLRTLLLELAHHCCMRCGGIEELQIDRFYPGSHGNLRETQAFMLGRDRRLARQSQFLVGGSPIPTGAATFP